jgi:hypothetical protein
MPKCSSSYSLDNWYLIFIMLYARKLRPVCFPKTGQGRIGPSWQRGRLPVMLNNMIVDVQATAIGSCHTRETSRMNSACSSNKFALLLNIRLRRSDRYAVREHQAWSLNLAEGRVLLCISANGALAVSLVMCQGSHSFATSGLCRCCWLR